MSMESRRLSTEDVAQLQREQYRHDQRNHGDIACLPKTDRLKHYGLHFAKYVGRLARADFEVHSVEKTIVDTTLICLSAANTLHQRLNAMLPTEKERTRQIDMVRPLADAAGRFADACEKIDHLEEFLPIARSANQDVLAWALAISEERELDLRASIKVRRAELADRQFYITD